MHIDLQELKMIHHCGYSIFSKTNMSEPGINTFTAGSRPSFYHRYSVWRALEAWWKALPQAIEDWMRGIAAAVSGIISREGGGFKHSSKLLVISDLLKKYNFSFWWVILCTESHLLDCIKRKYWENVVKYFGPLSVHLNSAIVALFLLWDLCV